jgi:hypothetical protein
MTERSRKGIWVRASQASAAIPSERGQHREEPLLPRDRRQSGASQASVEEVVVRGTTIDVVPSVRREPGLGRGGRRPRHDDRQPPRRAVQPLPVAQVRRTHEPGDLHLDHLHLDHLREYLYKYVYKGHDIRHPSTTYVIEFQERGQWSSEARPATMSARRHPSAAHTNRPAPLLDTGMPHAHMRYLTEARLEAQQSEP